MNTQHIPHLPPHHQYEAQNASYVAHHQQSINDSNAESPLSVRFPIGVRAATKLMLCGMMWRRRAAIGMYVKDGVAYCYIAPVRVYYGKTVPDFRHRVTLVHRKIRRCIPHGVVNHFPKWMRDYL
jgi:hypothetical protein